MRPYLSLKLFEHFGETLDYKRYAIRINHLFWYQKRYVIRIIDHAQRANAPWERDDFLNMGSALVITRWQFAYFFFHPVAVNYWKGSAQGIICDGRGDDRHKCNKQQLRFYNI